MQNLYFFYGVFNNNFESLDNNIFILRFQGISVTLNYDIIANMKNEKKKTKW